MDKLWKDTQGQRMKSCACHQRGRVKSRAGREREERVHSFALGHKLSNVQNYAGR